MSDARYDAIAGFYDGAVADRLDDNAGTSALLELCGDVLGLRVLEVACGQGRIARELARRGAALVGVDISDALLRIARAREADDPLGISYAHGDVSAHGTLARERFDLAVCNFGLSDVDDLTGALASVGRLVAPGGKFVFSILHPCFAGAGDDAPSSWPPTATYDDEGWWLADNPGFRGKVGANHRRLSSTSPPSRAPVSASRPHASPSPTSGPSRGRVDRSISSSRAPSTGRAPPTRSRRPRARARADPPERRSGA